MVLMDETSSVDDPLIWTVLPLRQIVDPAGMRWSLGAHDICFKSR